MICPMNILPDNTPSKGIAQHVGICHGRLMEIGVLLHDAPSGLLKEEAEKINFYFSVRSELEATLVPFVG